MPAAKTDGMDIWGIEPRRAASDAAGAPLSTPVELPCVIRPRPLRLVDIEGRIRGDAALAERLRTHPESCTVLARALITRDRQARLRFVDAEALALHLRTLVAG